MKRLLFKIFIYFLCISFFNSVACLENINLEAKEIGFPIGEIVSKGDVQFEAKEMVWRNIESPNFPIFKKGKIKTGNGTGIIHLANNCQIEVAQNSILSFDHVDQLHLSQGKINFRIPPGAEVIFRVETLLVTKSRIQQASKNATMGSAKN